MIGNRGQDEDMSVVLIVLKDPCYIAKVLSEEDAPVWVEDLKPAVERIIKIFDSKLVRTDCQGRGSLATYLSVFYDRDYDPMWWCENCDPNQHPHTEGGGSLKRLENIKKH